MPPDAVGPEALGRFAEPSLYILLALSDGPKHGYAIMGDIERASGARPGPGTMYGALARLERRGLIEQLDEADRRRPYRLTPAGADALRTHLDRLANLAVAGQARLAAAADDPDPGPR